jgi:GTPases
VPYDKGEVISYICDKGIVKSMEHREDGTLITAELLKADYSRVKKYGIV